MKTTFTAAGDMLIQRRIPADSDGFSEVSEFIKRGDARYVNLETTLNRGEFPANEFCGGSYLRANPEVLEEVKEYGFNMLTFCNNHCFDFGMDGLVATKKHIDEAGIVNAGAGLNLDEAAAPAYLDTKNGRIAIIGVVASMGSIKNETSPMAGRQSRRFKGRPGVNGLRCEEYLQVTKDQLETIKEIAALSGVNARKDISRAEGYQPPLPEDTVELKDLRFKVGDTTKYVTHPNKKDTERVKQAIREAKTYADYVIVAVHSHDISGDKKENPAEYIAEFAHACIDAGAHAVIGHGPHLLRPVEIYKGRPIFHSLGDFVIHNESFEIAPYEAYEKQGLSDDAGVRELVCKRSKNYTKGLMRDRRMLESVIPYFEMENGKITRLELMPIELHFDLPTYLGGNPRFSKDHGIIERLANMSAPYGTKIKIDNRGFGIVEL